jgi:hypothetical protein
MSSVIQQFRKNLNLPRYHKPRESPELLIDVNLFDEALNYLPIPSSFHSGCLELKGLNSTCLSKLEVEIGPFAQHMILIGRALRWMAFLKNGPVDWLTIKPFYINYYISKCDLNLEIVEKFMQCDLEKKTKVEDHLTRKWNDFRNSALIFWDRSLRYPSHELTYGALQDIYIRKLPLDSLLPWPSPLVRETTIFTMSQR